MSFNQPPPSQGEPASPAESTTPEGEGTGEQTQGTPATAEEVENQWRHRVSQKDKAHAAAEQALREENDALKRQMEALSKPASRPTNGQSGSAGNDPQVEALREQLAESQQAMERERQLRVLDARKAKYPALARQVGDAGSSIFSTADEATLAKLNAIADDSSSGTFAPTSPRRPAPASQKPIAEMSKAELELEMKRQVDAGALQREQR